MIKLREAGIEGSAGFKVVLTGGSANMPGLDQLMQRTLAIKVRIGVPDRPAGLPDELRSPVYSTAVGMVIWALKQKEHAGGIGRQRYGTIGQLERRQRIWQVLQSDIARQGLTLRNRGRI